MSLKSRNARSSDLHYFASFTFSTIPIQDSLMSEGLPNSNLYTPYLFDTSDTQGNSSSAVQITPGLHPFPAYSAGLLPPPTPQGIELEYRRPRQPPSGLVMSNSTFDDGRTTGSAPSTSGHSDSPGTAHTSASNTTRDNAKKRSAPTTAGELHSDKSCGSISRPDSEFGGNSSSKWVHILTSIYFPSVSLL